VSEVVEKGLWGVENLSGIPGTVGGAVVGNIGAYGQVQSQTLVWVEALNTTTGSLERFDNTQCAFGYRESVFSRTSGAYIVVRAAYRLAHTAQPDTTYADLQKIFSTDLAIKKEPTIEAIREAVLHIRTGKFPDLLKEGSAGSFFKNPIVSKEEAQALRERYPNMPQFSMPETDGVKIPLGWLIDHVLHLKGYREGGARLFEKQALVIAAQRGTSASAVRALANSVREKIFNECGINIEHEVKIIS
jgi:UDP-N-acetylmuramate dehydrogenase